MSTPAGWAGWIVRFAGAATGWLTIAGLVFICVAIVATVGLVIYGLIVGP